MAREQGTIFRIVTMLRSGGPRELHLVPGPTGWALVREGSERPLGVFGDLGAALDAATAGPGRVRVVVHGRKEW